MAIVDGNRCLDRSLAHIIPTRVWSKPKRAGLLITYKPHSLVDERVLYLSMCFWTNSNLAEKTGHVEYETKVGYLPFQLVITVLIRSTHALGVSVKSRRAK